MRALVTGGGGFLGKAIVRRLLLEGYSVRTFSRRRYPGLDQMGVDSFQGNISNGRSVEEACQGCDLVFHVAAKAGIWGNYEEYFSTNVSGTENVIQACRRLKISRLIYTSTPSVVFDGQDIDGGDERLPYASCYKAHYPKTKAVAEAKVLAANDAKLATVALRPHLIFGPDDRHLVPGILKRGRRGGLFRIGSLSKLVDFTYVDNAAEAHWLAAQKLEVGSAVAGRAFFVSNGQPTALWDFVNRVLQMVNLGPVERTISREVAYAVGCLYETVYGFFSIQQEPALTRFLVEQLSSAHWFNISAARRLLGYEPRIDIEEGLNRLHRWIMSQTCVV
jgi:nucleoside-diphosphate-sugar epimerase